MKTAEVIPLAHAALSFWDLPEQEPHLVSHRENAVFRVIDRRGKPAALRLHRPGYQSNKAIRSELTWAEGLAKAGLGVPRPIPTRHGDLIAPAPRIASLVTWIDGVPLGAGDRPLAWPPAQQLRLYRALGKALARLHLLSDTLTLPEWFERPRLDTQGLLGEAPLWGRFWENPALSPEERHLLGSARKQLRAILETASNHLDFGLIHADALRENVLVTKTQTVLIDFDDGAFGWRMYELGVAMSQNWQEENAARLSDALLDGYAGAHSLPRNNEALLHAFTTLRVLASCGWAISRYPPESDRMRLYAARATEAAQRYLERERLY